MGVSEPQEICEETYRRPRVVDKGHTGRDDIRLRGHLSFGAVRSDGYGYAAVDERQRKILRFAYAHTPAALPMILKILIYETFCFAVIIDDRKRI